MAFRLRARKMPHTSGTGERDLVDWGDQYWEQERRSLRPRIDELVERAGDSGIPKDRVRWYAFWLAYWRRIFAEYRMIEEFDRRPDSESEQDKLDAGLKRADAALAALEDDLRPYPRDLADVSPYVEQLRLALKAVADRKIVWSGPSWLAPPARRRGRPRRTDDLASHVLAFWYHYRRPPNWAGMYKLAQIWKLMPTPDDRVREKNLSEQQKLYREEERPSRLQESFRREVLRMYARVRGLSAMPPNRRVQPRGLRPRGKETKFSSGSTWSRARDLELHFEKGRQGREKRAIYEHLMKSLRRALLPDE